MNHNNLKRRRPPGTESDSSIVPAQQTSPLPLQLPLDFYYLPPDLQQQITEVASVYHLSGPQLHQIASQAYHESQLEHINKRHRSLQYDPMSSHFPGSSFPQDSSEKAHQAGQYGQHRLTSVDAGPSSALQGSGIANGLAERLANLVVCCQHCFYPVAVPDGYQLIPESNSFGYGTTTGYEIEKRPSADVAQQDVYVPTTISPSGANSFPTEENGLMSTYVTSYQPVRESTSQGLAAPPGAPDNLVYTPDIPETPYYTNISTSAAEVSHGLSNVTNHAVPASDLVPAPYDGNMIDMAVPSTLQHQSLIPVTTSGFSMTTPYTMEIGVQSEDLGQPAASARLDIVYPHQRPPASKRGPFKDIKQRQETANTRKLGSCVRCKMQRIRCVPDPEDPTGCCLTCSKHKQLPRQPCVRAKLTEVKCMKPGQVHGFEWTLRWGDNGPVDNIANWASSEVKTIEVTEGYTRGMSVQLHVRQFVPQRGDKLERSWVTLDGIKKSVPIPPYAITDLDEAQSAYQDYIRRGVVECFTSVIEGVMGARDHLLYATYRKAWELSQDLRTSAEERELLLHTLELWLAVRLTTKSVEIVGNETLGMDHGILDSSSPQHGSIPLPPVMGAQLDLVLIQHIQTKLRREMLERLQKMTQQNKQKTWLTTYLVTFILLHNIALLTNHDASYARKHGMKTKFARQQEVKEYHWGGTILLSYFHYCNKGNLPFTEDFKEQDMRQLAQLDEQAMQFIQWTRSQAMAHRHEWEKLHHANEYEKPYFFVSQLFQRDWKPQEWVY